VEYSFTDRRLARAVGSEARLRREYGKERAMKLSQRLAALRAAETAADLAMMPGRFHQLTGDRKGQLSLDLDGPYRLIFEPDKAESDDGEIDLASVCSVVICEIVDYH